MADDTYKITIELDNVAVGDVTDLAQHIWDENAADLDAKLNEFRMSISKAGFDIGWEPE